MLFILQIELLFLVLDGCISLHGIFLLLLDRFVSLLQKELVKKFVIFSNLANRFVHDIACADDFIDLFLSQI